MTLLAASTQGLGGEAASPDPVCGFIAGPHAYLENRLITNGPAINLLAGMLQPGQPANLRFQAVVRPRDLPMEPLQIEHEKLMHVLGVREDLSDFVHLHPVRTAPGMWETQVIFPEPGRYKFWTEIKYHGVNYSIAQDLLATEGLARALPAKRHYSHQAINGNFIVTLNAPDGFRLERTNALSLAVTDLAGQPVGLDNYLGAPMHLVLIRSDLTVCLHGHPEPRPTLLSPVPFREQFPTPGDYKLFAQFRPAKTGLGPDEALLAQFWIRVSSSLAAR